MPICFKGVAETAERSSFSARRPVRYARWAPRTSRAARAASYVSCVAPIARRSCKHMSAQNLRVEPMLAATCACSPHTALHFCCLSRPRTPAACYSPRARSASPTTPSMQNAAVVVLALLFSPADAFVLPASRAIAPVHIAGVPWRSSPCRSPVPGPLACARAPPQT